MLETFVSSPIRWRIRSQCLLDSSWAGAVCSHSNVFPISSCQLDTTGQFRGIPGTFNPDRDSNTYIFGPVWNNLIVEDCVIMRRCAAQNALKSNEQNRAPKHPIGRL